MATREYQRASDRDRDAVAERLRDAATEGRLSAQELDDRLTRAFGATTYGELDALTDDLPAPVPPQRPPGPELAGFWPRFAAFLIDALIVALIDGVLAGLLRAQLGGAIQVFVAVTYFAVLEGGPRGAGLGKQAMRIRVADAQTYGPIGYGRAIVRWLGHILSTIVLFLGYFWMLGDRDNQCWHDKLAGDVVIFSDGRSTPDPSRRR